MAGESPHEDRYIMQRVSRSSAFLAFGHTAQELGPQEDSQLDNQ